ncbi:vomeronasal type-1 receptor 4-like [Erethizon dorsatum]
MKITGEVVIAFQGELRSHNHDPYLGVRPPPSHTSGRFHDYHLGLLLENQVCTGGCGSRSTDVILRHLTVANSLYILSRGIPETMAALGMENFLNNVGCKLVFYIQVVGKGVSFSTTCQLSVFQAVTISPRSSRWAELKAKALKCTGPCTIICWVLHMLLNIRVPMLVSDKGNNANLTNTVDFQYCSAMSSDKDKNSIFAALTLSHDILCLELMIWSSGSMVCILYRHKQRTQHIHRHNTSSRSSPETRASQSILLLVCAFVSFYALSSITYVWFSLYDKAAWWLVKTSALIHACFPTASPFILMTREQCACRPVWKK